MIAEELTNGKHPPSIGEVHPSDSSYQLVWQDEFSGERLDRAHWIAEDDPSIGKYGHGNGESQVYLDAEGETYFVKAGFLNIVALYAPNKKYPVRDKPNGEVKQQIENLDFQSAKLTSERHASFTYGLIEARIKNPSSSINKKLPFLLGQHFGCYLNLQRLLTLAIGIKRPPMPNTSGLIVPGPIAGKSTLWKCQAERLVSIMPVLCITPVIKTGP
ncbi:MAG: glycoside hydrolase family 16 protein [Pirellulales bacterium]